jgi:hypothetical protein
MYPNEILDESFMRSIEILFAFNWVDSSGAKRFNYCLLRCVSNSSRESPTEHQDFGEACCGVDT